MENPATGQQGKRALVSSKRPVPGPRRTRPSTATMTRSEEESTLRTQVDGVEEVP
jgi:hypothetical protein